MKKILMLLVPVFCFGLFAAGCAPEPAKKPADKGAPAAKAPETKPADTKPAEKK